MQQGQVFEVKKRAVDRRLVCTLTLKELVDEFLAQHDAEPETIESSAGCSPRLSVSSAAAAFASFARKRSRPGG